MPPSLSPRSSGRARSLAALLLLSCGVASAQSAALLPHKATYALGLHPSARGGDVAAVKGRLEVVFESSCDGWRVEQFLGFHMLGQDGSRLEHVAYLSGFESLDGREFVFSTRTWEDRTLVEQLSGVARRLPGERRAQVRYARPEARVVELPADTIFPSRHVAQVLAAALDGQRSVLRTVFDGSTDESPFQISTYIGREQSTPQPRPAALRGHTRWPLRLAYFRVGAVEPAPEFEMSVNLYDNGVAGDMVYDYGDFAIDVRIEQVEMLTAPSCD